MRHSTRTQLLTLAAAWREATSSLVWSVQVTLDLEQRVHDTLARAGREDLARQFLDVPHSKRSWWIIAIVQGDETMEESLVASGFEPSD